MIPTLEDTMKTLIALLVAGLAGAAAAATPVQIRDAYAAEAAGQTPAFQPSAERGAAFFHRRFAVSDAMPACASCHTEQPGNTGRHVITGKSIRPLAVAANAERLSDSAKVEKWFGRNCKEVVGRACSAAEKADFVQYLMSGG